MKEFEGYRVDFHNFMYAMQDIKELHWTPEQHIAMMKKILGVDTLSVDVSAKEAESTLLYLVKQWFDPLYEKFSLKDAHEKAQAMIAKNPWNFKEYTVKYDKDGMPILDDDAPTNEDGVTLNKSGKVPKGYKKARALALYRENRDSITERKDWIELFMNEISGMTKTVAHVYMSNIANGKWAV